MREGVLSVNDFLFVDVGESLDQVIEVILNFYFRYSFPAFHHFIESVVTAQLQNDIDVLAVLEDVVEE